MPIIIELIILIFWEFLCQPAFRVCGIWRIFIDFVMFYSFLCWTSCSFVIRIFIYHYLLQDFFWYIVWKWSVATTKDYYMVANYKKLHGSNNQKLLTNNILTHLWKTCAMVYSERIITLIRKWNHKCSWLFDHGSVLCWITYWSIRGT